MNFKQLWIIAGLVLVSILTASSQDIHFSQYYSSPLTLNPALTGNFNGSFRVAANYRNQWFSIPGSVPYVTYSGSFDAALLRNLLEYDQLGVGVMVFNDKSGNGELTNLTGLVSIAYHKTLDRYNKHQISLGFQGGIVQKRIDFSKLTFEEQYQPDVGFNPLLSNKESIENTSIIYPDFNAGAFWHSAFSDKFSLYAGFGFFHINEPKESFLTQFGQQNKLDSRIVVHGGLVAGISDYVKLNPGFLYMNQAGAQEITVGTAFDFNLAELTDLYLGAWYRARDRDAIIAMAGFEYHGFRIGLSYDINSSDLKTVTNGNGAFEIALSYIYNLEPPRKATAVKFCPRF